MSFQEGRIRLQKIDGSSRKWSTKYSLATITLIDDCEKSCSLSIFRSFDSCLTRFIRIVKKILAGNIARVAEACPVGGTGGILCRFYTQLKQNAIWFS